MTMVCFDRAFVENADGPVLVVGAAGIDLVGRLQGELLLGTSNPSNTRWAFGGTARNVAENLARLGHSVILLTAVGTDQWGEELLEQASDAGVEVSSVIRTPDHPTGTYMAVIDDKGDLVFALDDMRAVSTISPEYIRSKEELFHQASLLFVDANVSKRTLRTVFSLARQAGRLVCADPTSLRLAEKLKPYLHRLFLIVPNLNEATLLSGYTTEASIPVQGLEVAKSFVHQGVELAVVTLAEFGVCYATAETSGHIPAIQTDIYDPTGAGDALTATILFALLNDIPVDEAVRLGVSAASITLQHQGAVVPDLSLEMLYDRLVI
ncbi:MAG: carbohydrate kinase family protein [Chloroflexota bacterium]